jgi:DNA-binding transcriptional regulator YdaS (Cro superfamily)
MPGLIAARLRVELKKKNWSQRKFAKILGVSEGNVSKWLKGDHEPSGEHLEMINAALGLEPGWQISEIASASNAPTKETALNAAVQLDWLVAIKASRYLLSAKESKHLSDSQLAEILKLAYTVGIRQPSRLDETFVAGLALAQI